MKLIVDVSIMPLGVGLSLSRYVACECVFERAVPAPQLGANGTNLDGDWERVLGAVKRCHG